MYDDNNRKLVNIPAICEKYNVKTINVRYKDPDNPNAHISIPVKFDLIVRLKVWIAYDKTTQQLHTSNGIIGVDNFWLDTLAGDVANGRIDITQYLYE